MLITAGATREKLDPVRYFTNHSTGKMGFAVAEVAKRAGANVTLITSTRERLVPPGVNAVYVGSAEEMYAAVKENQAKQDAFVMTAAVADYTPQFVSEQKIKKQPGDFKIEMKRTKDILADIGETKTANQVVVGFAAETENIRENALKKLASKKADFIVANDITDAGAGFGTDTNIVTIYGANGSEESFPLLDKSEVAKEIVKRITSRLEQK
ncbi:phosphopantothenoylcysteine decarboxylase/phosphopantothenate--cysteine ligase [Listeria fleischmannii subsp. fleischmannii LU2006-1]|nr:phosphopantothenoylcysteine decarboxylase/phosphopantothenate--cysteine ligase [Listeria fleischmannii subsp. fleischmannii LU2006-1]